MKIICMRTVFGQTLLANITTASGDQGLRTLQMVKPGNQFWAWPTIPAGKVIGADFDYGEFSWGSGAPVCAETAEENNAILAELAANGPAPEDVLTYKQPS